VGFLYAITLFALGFHEHIVDELCHYVELSRAMDEEYRMDEEEEDVMGLPVAANASDDDFVPLSELGKG
jgi:hypothetical protein